MQARLTRFVRRFAVLVLAGAGANAMAQTFPAKPIRIVVSFPPGAGTDLIARLVGRDMQESFGQPVVVENRPGAAGNIATEIVAKSPADGYTLLMVNSTFASNVALFPNFPYDPIRHFAPIALLGGSPLLIAASPASGIESLKDLITRARAQPGKFTYASCGNGGPPHIVGEQFMRLHRLDVTHVPYKGCGPATTDTISGQVPILFTNMSSAVAFIPSGKIRPLAVALNKRSALAPAVPTVAESGLGELDADLWFGLVAPAGTSLDTIAKLNRETVRVLSLRDVREKLQAQTVEPRPGTPAEFAAYIKSEVARYTVLIRELGIKAD